MYDNYRFNVVVRCVVVTHVMELAVQIIVCILCTMVAGTLIQIYDTHCIIDKIGFF